jgi:hypothetical protein
VEHTVPECADPVVEAEAQAMLAAYKAHYPVQVDANGIPFKFIEAEKFFEVPIPGTKHTYMGEWDGIVRMEDTGRIKIFETKTEKRGSKANTPQAWACKPQVALYRWAAEHVYGEPCDGIVLNVMTRQSPKGEVGPTFRRDNLERSDAQIADAIANLTYFADKIEEMEAKFGKDGCWPQNRENCFNDLTGWPCDFHALHILGRTPENLTQYQEAKEYLAL